MPPDVPLAFFSYSREDSEFALKLAADLKSAGANVWIDRLDIKPGQWWDKSVEEALNQCPRMLVILSPASVNSKNVLDEVSFAMEEQKTVVPVLYQECHIPFRLRRVQYVDFTKDYAQALQRLLDALAARPVPTTDVIQAAMVKEALAAEKARQEREASQPPAKPQPEEPGRQGIAAEQAHAEEERQRIAAEQARLDDEQKKAAAEKARLQELERRAAEEKSKQAEAERQAIAAEQARLQQERQRLAAEQARLEEERQQAAAEKARLLQLEQERQAAAEKARLEEKRKQAAAQKARREQEEREARQRRETEESQRLAAASAVVVVPAGPPASDDLPLVSDSPQSSWMKPALIGLAVVLVIGLISVLVWQRSNEADEREAYARSLADERARADRAQQQASGQQSSTATPSGQPSAAPAPGKAPPEKPQPTTTAKLTPPPPTTASPIPTTTSRPLVTTPPPVESTPSIPSSPFDGTWRIDYSTYHSTETAEFLLQNGNWGEGSTPFRADGSLQKVTGNHFLDQLSITVLDNYNVMMIARKSGKEVNSYKYSVSTDGTTMALNSVDYNWKAGGPVISEFKYRRLKYGPSGCFGSA